jgi:hypothetical protein
MARPGYLARAEEFSDAIAQRDVALRVFRFPVWDEDQILLPQDIFPSARIHIKARLCLQGNLRLGQVHL